MKRVTIFVSQYNGNEFKKLQKIKIMTTENFKTIDDILESEFFNQMFDFETEKKEIEQAGWNYNELRKFGHELSKKIEPKN